MRMTVKTKAGDERRIVAEQILRNHLARTPLNLQSALNRPRQFRQRARFHQPQYVNVFPGSFSSSPSRLHSPTQDIKTVRQRPIHEWKCGVQCAGTLLQQSEIVFRLESNLLPFPDSLVLRNQLVFIIDLNFVDIPFDRDGMVRIAVGDRIIVGSKPNQ